MNRLYCDNLNDFILGMRHYYTVYEGAYREGDSVILYNDHHEALFTVMNVIRHEGKISLGLIREANLRKINSYYAGTNPLD